MSIGFQVRATIANLAFGIGTTSIMKVERHAIAWVAYLLRSRYMKTSGQRRTRHKNDPWEVLVVAGLFFFPGLFMLFQLHAGCIPTELLPRSLRLHSAFRAWRAYLRHARNSRRPRSGLVYFYLRRAITRDEGSQKPRWR